LGDEPTGSQVAASGMAISSCSPQAMLEILMRQPEREDDADNPLRLCYTGPAPDRERHLEIERRFGLRIVCGYAMSETPYGLIWPHGSRLYGTLGTVRQHPTLGIINEAIVVDDASQPVASGEPGELLLRNPAVTPGYWQMPAETAAAITTVGWLHTGDLVTGDDDGVYTFIARRKEVLRRRGENLSPVEVEDVILAHPSVVEVPLSASRPISRRRRSRRSSSPTVRRTSSPCTPGRQNG
jgi:carnitine-CoA ligase